MRINRENTLIEDNSYPLEGLHEDDIVDYLTRVFEPYSYIIEQIQGALYLHNFPLYCAMVTIACLFTYSFKVVCDSKFPTILFLLILYPLGCFAIKIGGNSLLRSLCIDLPILPENAPNRIRSVREIVALAWKPYVFGWRILFSIYRVFVKPNAIDILVLIIITTLIGLVLCVIDGALILTVLFTLFLVFPPLLTRNFVYYFLMAHLGNIVLTHPEIKNE